MLVDWVHWLRSQRIDELLLVIIGLLLVDGPRYVLTTALVAFADLVDELVALVRPRSRTEAYTHCPSVCVLLAGHNEADCIAQTLSSVWGTYPRLEIVVIDDGSSDGMAGIAQDFAVSHAGVLVLSRPDRGGKSSALNWGLSCTAADVVVTVDADSRLGSNAIWEIVQPLQDPTIGAVAGTIRVWNAETNLCTWLQAWEYRQAIFVGRLIQARFGFLSIVSGAFGAFRRPLLERLHGWDAGSGEDGDLALRIRKAGYQIAAASYAECHTCAPTSWRRLFRQRLRWERAVVTFECRKHRDMASISSRNFRFDNFLVIVERRVIGVFAVLMFWLYLPWIFILKGQAAWNLLALLYLCQLVVEVAQALLLMFFSKERLRDLQLAVAIPLVPLYYVFLKAASLVAILDETFLRKSHQDNFVPRKVRRVTWHW